MPRSSICVMDLPALRTIPFCTGMDSPAWTACRRADVGIVRMTGRASWQHNAPAACGHYVVWAWKEKYEYNTARRLNEDCIILTLYGHIKIVEQRTIIQQYGDWYTGRWWVGCYIWSSDEGSGRAAVRPSPLLAVPNVTAHPSVASVPTSYYWTLRYNCLWTIRG